MRVMKNPLLDSIAQRKAKIGVVGLGYVGLPLGMAFAEAGFDVLGLDIDQRKIDKLQKGESYIKHISGEPIKRLTDSKKLAASSDFSKAAEMDCIIICVPTPLTAAREPDMSFIVNASEAVAPYVRPGQLFVLESSTYPGTTDEVMKPILERGGLKAGVDFYLAFSPEREDPGNKSFNTKTIPKIVGGYSPACMEAATALYASALKEVVPVSSTRVAEMAKLLENIFRCVNIALVNELKMLCDRMKMDVWEVIQAAGTKPFGFMPFYPGPGLGGHCIPIDPFYLTWKAREFEFQTKFIELAGDINTGMPLYVVQRTMEALNGQKKSLNGAKIVVLGAAYKKDIDDMRESPSLRVMTLLKERGADVVYHDPYVPKIEKGHGFNYEMTSVPFTNELLQNCDAALILTDHSDINYDNLVAQAPITIDTRNATKNVTRNREKIVKA
ncbi:MAG: nucleotide sugar dehydrogenase [Myxococcaceae bacterium]